jgi:hypothetical protein
MQHILDNISAQINSGKTLSQHKYHYALMRHHEPQFIKDIYPFGSDYYHELNPFFLVNILRPIFLDFCKTITVRDGKVTFAAYMAQNVQFLKNSKTQFFIHPSLTYLIPPQHLKQFQGWRIKQDKIFDIRSCQHLLIAGLGNKNGIGSIQEFESKIKLISELPKNAKIEIFIPIRKNPLIDKWEDDYLPFEISILLKKHAQDRALSFIDAEDFFDKQSFEDIHLIELFQDNLLISDSFLSHYVVSKGGIAQSFEEQINEKVIYELDLSLHHKIQIINLPKVKSFFNEILFYKKLNPHYNYYQDPGFKDLIEKQNLNFSPIT